MPTDTSNQYSPSGKYDVGTLRNRAANIYPKPQAVTQLTTVSTAVTCNGTQGVITMFAGPIVNGTSATFIVNNSSVRAGDSVQATVSNFTGTYFTNGAPTAQVQNVVDGAFNIVILNNGAATTGANAIKVSFKVN